MRVCLINPPRIQPKFWGKPNVFQPIEMAYVAAVLERQHKVRIIDAPTEGFKNLEKDGGKYRVGLSNKEIADRIRRWSPDVVGISIPYSGWSKPAFEVASTVKSNDKDVITVLDGTHPSARPIDCLTNPNLSENCQVYLNVICRSSFFSSKIILLPVTFLYRFLFI